MLRWLIVCFWRQTEDSEPRAFRGGNRHSRDKAGQRRGSRPYLSIVADGTEAGAGHAIVWDGVLLPRLVLQRELAGDSALLQQDDGARVRQEGAEDS
eukprot:COSAG02_NODE_209_length_28965_cov_18.680143_29_plen_97_part_00